MVKISTNIKNFIETITKGLSYTKTEIDTKLANKANTNHTHDISALEDSGDILGSMENDFYTALDTKADKTTATTSANGLMSKEDKSKLNGIATEANKTIVDSSLSSSSTNPVQNKVVKDALDGKAKVQHNHTFATIVNLQSTLNSKSEIGHTHDDRYYTETEMNTKLNGKANSSHTHSIGNVTNLQSKLDTIPSLTSTSITVSGTDNQGTITFYKFGKIVVMELDLLKVHLTQSWNVVGTIPNGYMPKLADGAGAPFVFWHVQGQQGQSAQLNIKSTGEIRFAYGNGETPQLHTYVTYIVN